MIPLLLSPIRGAMIHSFSEGKREVRIFLQTNESTGKMGVKVAPSRVPKASRPGPQREADIANRLYRIYRKLGVTLLATHYANVVKSHPQVSNVLHLNDGWKVKEVSRTRMTMAKGGTVIELDRSHGLLLITQVHSWKAMYLPPFCVVGKTILDVGAGAGETCALFFEKGAAKVIAVEPDLGCVTYLQKNAKRNGWNVQVIHSALRPEHLSLPHDFCKMDCEGGEVELLKVNRMGPLVVQLHPSMMSKNEYRALIRKFELKYLGDRVWTNCGK